jgi:hypothetical protein
MFGDRYIVERGEMVQDSVRCAAAMRSAQVETFSQIMFGRPSNPAAFIAVNRPDKDAVHIKEQTGDGNLNREGCLSYRRADTRAHDARLSDPSEVGSGSSSGQRVVPASFIILEY